MAKGYQANREHQAALSALGKELTRRAGSKCELCESGGVPLSPYEIPPAPPEPSVDHCVFICDSCRSQIEKPKSIRPETWRPLTNTVWSDLPPVQVMAIRVLSHLAKSEPWASEILDNVFADEKIDSWATEAALGK